MDIDEVSRPRQLIADFKDNDHRIKCCVCCAGRHSFYVFAALWCINAPIAIALFGSKKVLASFLSFADYTLLIPLPSALVTFTHQALLSESLWSKNKKTVLECNIESSAINVGLWTVGIALGTYVWRNVLVHKNKTFRMLQWDYRRKNRSAANKYLPSMFGTVSIDMDWYNIMWAVWGYHVFWAAVTILLEKQQGAHYAMLYRNTSFSKRCSPRWREWREHRVRETVDTEHKVVKGRWGNMITSDPWKARGVD